MTEPQRKNRRPPPCPSAMPQKQRKETSWPYVEWPRCRLQRGTLQHPMARSSKGNRKRFVRDRPISPTNPDQVLLPSQKPTQQYQPKSLPSTGLCRFKPPGTLLSPGLRHPRLWKTSCVHRMRHLASQPTGRFVPPTTAGANKAPISSPSPGIDNNHWDRQLQPKGEQRSNTPGATYCFILAAHVTQPVSEYRCPSS